MKKKIFSAIMIFSAALIMMLTTEVMAAHTTFQVNAGTTIKTSGMYKYFVTASGNAVITDITGNPQGEYTLPSEIDNYSAVAVCNKALEDLYGVTSLNIPDSYISLCIKAADTQAESFLLNSGIQEPSGAKGYSFTFLPTNIKYLKIGKNLTEIGCAGETGGWNYEGHTTFESLERIDVDPENKQYYSQDGIMFSKKDPYTGEEQKSVAIYPLSAPYVYYTFEYDVYIRHLKGAKNLKRIVFGGWNNYDTWTNFNSQDNVEIYCLENDENALEKAKSLGWDKCVNFVKTSYDVPHIAYFHVTPSEGYIKDGNYEGTTFTITATTCGAEQISVWGDMPDGTWYELSYDVLKSYGLKYTEGEAPSEKHWEVKLPFYNAGQPRIFRLYIDGMPVDGNLNYWGVYHVDLYRFSPTPQQDPISVTVNGEYINFDVPPQMINNRTMVPVRAIAEALGAKVEWNEFEGKITIRKGDDFWVQMFIGDSNMAIAQPGASWQGSMYLDSPPIIINGRTLIPVRALSEAFLCNINWDEQSRTVTIQEWN